MSVSKYRCPNCHDTKSIDKYATALHSFDSLGQAWQYQSSQTEYVCRGCGYRSVVVVDWRNVPQDETKAGEAS